MTKVSINTGLAWVQSFTIDCDDLDQGITDYVMQHKEEFTTYTYVELEKEAIEYFDGEPYDEIDDIDFYIWERYHSINGGDFYINSIAYCEEV